MKRFIQLILVLLGSLMLMQQAAATQIKVTGMRYANPTTVNVKSASPFMSEYVYAGAFATTDGTNSFDTWCVDLFKDTHLGELVKDYVPTAAELVLGADKVDLLTRLATEALGLVVNGVTSGAFQLAMWEIVNESVGAPYDLLSGNFKAWNASDGSIVLAQNWLNSLPVSSTYSMSVLASRTHQNLAVFTRTPVPEPATIALLGLGLFGFAAARRRRS